MSADKMMGYVRFAWQLRPVVKELLQELYRWTKGDPAKAAAALRRIKDHGLRLDEAERAVDRRIAAVEERDKS